jgi:UDP-N-acetylmuramoyl-tripeptide--D-alanyl-D-alanine ligase
VLALQTELLGAHQVAPIAAAAVIADSLGLSAEQIQKGVQSITAFERRFEPKYLADNVVLIDDTYNGNPSGFKVGMDFLDGLELEGRRRVYATPGIIELGADAYDIHWQLGERLAKTGIEHVIFFDTPLSHVMHEAYTVAGGQAHVSVVASQLEFMQNIEHFVRPDDVILLQNSQREEYFYLQ